MTDFEKLTLKTLIVNTMVFLLSLVCNGWLDSTKWAYMLNGATSTLFLVSLILFLARNKIEAYLDDLY